MSSKQLPCFSIRQPFASLIVAGALPFLSQEGPAPRTLTGRWVGIHATDRRPTGDEMRALGEAAFDLGSEWLRNIPLGAVVGIVNLAGSYRIERCNDLKLVLSNGREIAIDGFNDFTIGRWVWGFSAARVLTPPIAAKGDFDWWLWTPPPGATSEPAI